MFGITEKLPKTYSGISLNFMKENDYKNLAFLIGFIDGDGSINKTNKYIIISCHESWLNTFTKLISLFPEEYRIGMRVIKQKITNNNFNPPTIKHMAQIYINKITALRLLQYIDMFNIPSLDRKWDILRNQQNYC